MTSLQPLRDALTSAVLALGKTEKLLVKVARKEATLTEVWREAAHAYEALRSFDKIMAELKAAHDARKP